MSEGALMIGRTWGYVLALTFLLSCQSILITYSKKAGYYEYSTTSTVLFAEILKFIIAAGLL
jgi:hypothetical protein